ncbi:O-antigen ligase family protein [bacterium]|nr:O-antigen ligase family protein [bacterium]
MQKTNSPDPLPTSMQKYWIIAFIVSMPIGIFFSQLFAGLGILVAGIERFKNKLNWAISHPALWLVGAFVLVNVLSALLSENPLHSLKRFTQYYGFPFISLMTAYYLARSEKMIELGLKTILISGAIMSLYAIWQHFTGIDILGHNLTPLDYAAGLTGYKATGLFSLTLTFSGMQMVFFVVVLPWLWKQRGHWQLYGWVANGLIGLSILLTYQRSAWIGVFFGLLLFFATIRGKWATYLKIGFIVLVITAIVAVPSIRGKVMQSFDFQQQNQKERLYLWPAAWEMGKDHFLTGVGPGMFGQYLYDYYPKDMDHRAHAHNEFLQYWATSGLIGTVVVSFLFLAVLWVGWRDLRRYKQQNSYRQIYLGSMITFFAFAVASLFQCYILDAENAIALGMIMGLGFAGRELMMAGK